MADNPLDTVEQLNRIESKQNDVEPRARIGRGGRSWVGGLGSSRPEGESGKGGSAVVLTICATAKLTTIMMMVER
ncbi:hypothetical protein CPT32_09530 [Rhizobium sophoriradicis]|nr:hypothetical protein CPT32_09530 [Rhizobium sophoriradicis]